MVPAGAGQYFAVQFGVPEDFQFLSLGVVVEAREANQRGVGRTSGSNDSLDEILPLADADDLTRLWRLCNFQHEGGPTGGKERVRRARATCVVVPHLHFPILKPLYSASYCGDRLLSPNEWGLAAGLI
jgi:hypothetical protein